MRPLWSIDEIKGVLEIDTPLQGNIQGVAINSQETHPGDLFIPLRGSTHDGHKFVREALSKGASAALIDHFPENLEMTSKLLQVSDTYEALVTLAAHARHRTEARIVGITGSVGKTTTKELLNLILRKQGMTSASLKSYNNQWGVPLSLCRLPQHADYGLFEVGMNHKGEISQLVKILKPEVVLITEVCDAHRGNFQNIEEIIDAKAEIFQGMGSQGIAILNRDSHSYHRLLDHAQQEGLQIVVTFGHHLDSTLRLDSMEPFPTHQSVTFTTQGVSYSFTLKAVGAHWVMNALSALATVHALGGNLSQACQTIEEFELLEGRGKQHHLPHPSGGTFILIDESYNASPTALEKALETLKTLEPVNGGRRIAVLGDLYELGHGSEPIYQTLAQSILQNKVDCVYTSGEDIRALFKRLPLEKQGFHAETVPPIAEKLSQNIHPGDIILVKGSRGAGAFPRMAEVIHKLMEGIG